MLRRRSVFNDRVRRVRVAEQLSNPGGRCDDPGAKSVRQRQRWEERMANASGRRKVVRAACPHDCPDTCAMLVTVENGRAVRVTGDLKNPFTHGALCSKV